MKRSIYFSLMISAIAGLVMFGAGVPKGYTNQDRVQTVPESWRGLWQVTVSYRDQDIGTVIATDVSTAEICPGEAIIPPLLNRVARCSFVTADNEISVSCARLQRGIRNGGCNVSVAAELNSTRDGDIWSGTGNWSTSTFGDCEPANRSEDFVVTGMRLSTEAACDGQPSSLVKSFFAHGELIPWLRDNTRTVSVTPLAIGVTDHE